MLAAALLGALGAAWQDPFVLDEGKGIRGVAELGGPIERVQAAWGAAERVVREDWPASRVWFHEYHARGALFAVDRAGRILGVTLYCFTGRTEPFHQAGLMWINPGSVYKTFHGETARGLRFKDFLTPQEIYAVYGKPVIKVERRTELLQSLIRNEEPFIVDDQAAGLTIHYPVLDMTWTVFDGVVESCHLGGLHDPDADRRYNSAETP